MGNVSRTIYGGKKQKKKLLMLGLDAAGKTTILYRLSNGAEVTTTIPTIGFNVEQFEDSQFDWTVWDVGGRDKIRPLWRHYFANTSGFIFVVDSNDSDRIGSIAPLVDWGTAFEEFNKVINEDELRDVPVLILANKKDLPKAMSVNTIVEKWGLPQESLTNSIFSLEDLNKHIDQALSWLIKDLRQIIASYVPLGCRFHIVPTSAVTSTDKGIEEGLKWITRKIEERQNYTK